MIRENLTASPDFHYDVARLHRVVDAIVVEGAFRGTRGGPRRGLPPAGRPVDFPVQIVF